MKRKKLFNWYGARQRFSIRTYHFGAASVLLGLTLATGAQAVQAEELATDATVTSSIQSSATTDTTPALSTETVTSAERIATINYLVNYVLEDGTLVNAVVKTATITTTEAVASTSVEVAVEVPAGYELAQGQATTVTQVVTEGAENLVTVQFVKKAEVVAPTTEAATEAPATTTEAATETPADATEVAAPMTAEEVKVVLEQNISEAVTLSDEANRLYIAAPEGNESLKAAADATKLTVTEATTVLKDSAATLEAVNAQIDTVRTNVEALALELRKRDEDGVLTASLSVVTSGTLGKGTGVQVLTGPTVSPSMEDPKGALVSSTTSGTLKPTEIAGYTTFKFFPLGGNSSVWYDNTVGVPRGYGGQSTDGAYLRASVATDASDEILVELVDKNGNVLETHIMSPTQTAEFTHFQAQSANIPIIASYSEDSISDSAFGTLLVTFDKNTISPNSLIPRLITNTTSYVTEEGEILGTYKMVTMPGLTNTPSGKREFSGYEFVKTTTSTVEVTPVAGASYVEQVRQGYPLNWADGGPYFQYKTIVRPVAGEKAVVKEIWIADPNYTGTHDYSTTSEDGFIKIITSSKMGIGQSNTEFMLDPGLIGTYKVTTQAGGTLRDLTDASQLNLSTLGRNEWIDIRFRNESSGLSHLGITNNGSGGVNYLQLHFGRDRRPSDTPDTMLGITLPVTLRYAGVNMTETTHWYRQVIQEAIIRYQVEGATDFLEDSGTLTGNPGTDITYSTEATINKYKKLGYELVSDGFTIATGQDYDYDTAVKQEFLVVIKPRVVDVPKTAVPGQPVNPTDPNSPIWPATVENLKTTQEVTRTVEYKYEDGTPVLVDATGNVLPKGSTEGTPFVKTKTVTFTRPAQVNLVTGDITYGEWSADTTDTLKGNVLPEVPGYSTSRTTLEGADAPMTETVNDKTVTATDKDINEVVYYTENPKYGDVVVNYVNTDGKVIATSVVDTNDALVGTDYSTADQVPEKIIEDATGDVYYYKEIKPEDAAKETGTVVEGTTEVTYVYEKAGNVVVNYTLADGTVIKSPVKDEENAEPGKTYSTEDNKPTTITTEDGKTYKLVPNATTGEENGTITSGEDKQVTYVYEEVKGSVVIRYVEAGNESNVLKDPVLDENAVVTGTKYDTTDEGDKPAEIVKDGVRYVLVSSKTTAVDPNGNPVTETGEVAEGTTVVTYKYQKVANWIPQIPGVPEGQEPKVPYPFDPNNPDVPVTPTPDTVIPYVPGYVPVDPKTNKPLKPVDPTDPSKGYVPPTVDNPGEDTPITYVPVTPVTPPVTPAVPAEPVTPVTPATSATLGVAQSPNTGEAEYGLFFGAATLSILAGLGLVAKKRKDEEEA